MADNKPGFIRGIFGRIGDSIALGNNYNRQTGQWSATPGQWLGGVGARALGVVAPGLGTLAGMVGNGLYGSGPLSGVLDSNGDGLGGVGGRQIGSVQREPIGIPQGRVTPNQGAAPVQGVGLVGPADQSNYQSPGALGQSSFDSQGGSINDRMNQWGQGGGSRRDSRSGNSAGSSVLAEGPAAQDMVGNWQISNWINGSGQAAQQAVQKMFGGHQR